MILYRAVRGAILGFCRLWFRLTIEGRENVPADGAFVLAPVHRSFMDFGFVSGVTRRRLRYMGKAELWKSAVFGRLLSALGAFPERLAGHPRARLVPWNATPGEWNDVLLESAEAIPASRTLRSRVVTT